MVTEQINLHRGLGHEECQLTECADCHRKIEGEELRKREYYSYFNPDPTIGDKEGQRLLCTKCQREHDRDRAMTDDYHDPPPETTEHSSGGKADRSSSGVAR